MKHQLITNLQTEGQKCVENRLIKLFPTNLVNGPLTSTIK